MDNNGKWTVEDDAKLTEAVKELGKDGAWSLVSGLWSLVVL
jgi:hypothetical protein